MLNVALLGLLRVINVTEDMVSNGKRERECTTIEGMLLNRFLSNRLFAVKSPCLAGPRKQPSFEAACATRRRATREPSA